MPEITLTAADIAERAQVQRMLASLDDPTTLRDPKKDFLVWDFDANDPHRLHITAYRNGERFGRTSFRLAGALAVAQHMLSPAA